MRSILGKDFTFKDCEEFGASDITGRPPQTFHVAHYHADNSRNGVSATGVNGFNYFCTWKDPGDFNARRPTCSSCNPPPRENIF
ncbi:hypothetical protein PSHT_01322 [Puccinia striiformis]|uniref:Uncharacterized protein n=1 Tax=Puccinia striiformis TaxID=27350 RepID=A0A2S4WKS6_9BASI|nr:hypothetical protein PSHT_01322 [Puccinia striiformis]